MAEPVMIIAPLRLLSVHDFVEYIGSFLTLLRNIHNILGCTNPPGEYRESNLPENARVGMGSGISWRKVSSINRPTGTCYELIA